MIMHVHRFAIKEGSRGWRGFMTVRRRDASPTLLDAKAELYVASGARHAGIGLRTDEDTSGLQLFVGVPHVLNAYLTAGSPTAQTWAYKRHHVSLPDVDIADLRFHDRAVWWSLWHDKWSWHRDTPRWRKGDFHWWDFLTGKNVYSSEVVEGPVEVTVPMPEGGYRATVTIERCTWKRPRWPWPTVAYSYDVDILSRPGPVGPYVPENGEPGYIPEPGKGENAWDCGPDGIFAMSGPGRTVEEAIGQVVTSALRTRRRRGEPADYAEPIT